MNREEAPLLFKNINSGLSVLFATLCVVDIFGVFPIIALPRAIVQCGLYGIPLVLIVFGLQIYTATLLGKSWIIAMNLDPQISRKNRYPLAAVTELTLGPRARTIITWLLDLTVFGGGIPNLLVASQNLQIFGFKVSDEKFDLSFCYWLLVVGVLLCPFMWLGSPRDMKWLATFSSITIILTAILIWWCIIVDDRNLDVSSIPTSPGWDKFISGYGMLAFQFDIHPTLMTIQVDMSRPHKIHKAIVSAFILSGSLFALTTGLAVWKYGGSTSANLLQMVPPSIMIQGAILLAALQLCLSSAIGHSALFQHLEDHYRIQRSFGWKRCAIRSAVVFLGVIMGESVPRFDIVMALIGGSLTGPLVFVLPPLVYHKAIALQKIHRDSAFETYSTGIRDENLDNLINVDKRIHSRSMYYGFLETPKLKNITHRYSYAYYDALSDTEDPYLGRGKGNVNLHNLSITITHQNERSNEPIFLEASRQVSTSSFIAPPKINNSNSMGISSFLQKYFGYLIVLLGIIITFSSTYINVKNTIRYVRFTPPCIFNVSITAFKPNSP